MTKLLTAFVVTAGLCIAPMTQAAERSVTLAVQNMNCAACPYTVRSSLQAIPGVAKVIVSFKDKTAVVTYDDTKTDIEALTTATTNAGYPSAPKADGRTNS